MSDFIMNSVCDLRSCVALLKERLYDTHKHIKVSCLYISDKNIYEYWTFTDMCETITNVQTTI